MIEVFTVLPCVHGARIILKTIGIFSDLHQGGGCVENSPVIGHYSYLHGKGE